MPTIDDVIRSVTDKAPSRWAASRRGRHRAMVRCWPRVEKHVPDSVLLPVRRHPARATVVRRNDRRRLLAL